MGWLMSRVESGYEGAGTNMNGRSSIIPLGPLPRPGWDLVQRFRVSGQVAYLPLNVLWQQPELGRGPGCSP